MKLKSFGCSFIFGTDLHDDGRGELKARPSQHTWPALLSRKLGYGYECYARPGAGNLRILERILLQAADPEPALFVIGWTWIDRFDYTDLRDNWKTIMPVDTDDVAEVYYKNLHSQYRDKLATLTSIKLAVDTLKQSNRQFIMTYMDDLIWETQWHCNPAILSLQEYVKPYFTDFEGKTFLEWSRSNRFPISDMLHPLELAHDRAAGLVDNKLDQCIKK